MSRVPLGNSQMMDLDSSNIKQTEDSDIFICNEKLATLDRNFETILNLDNSLVGQNSGAGAFKKQDRKGSGQRPQNNFTFNVKNTELIFNKRKPGGKVEKFEEYQRAEQDKETLIENIRLSGYKKSRDTSGALEGSLRTGDSSHGLTRPSIENSHHNSGKQSIFTRKGSAKRRDESNQSLEEYEMSGRKRQDPPSDTRGYAQGPELQGELIQIVRENEQLKMKNKQLKDLAKKFKAKNKERREYIKELNGALEEALHENENLEAKLEEMRRRLAQQEKYIHKLEEKRKKVVPQKREKRGRSQGRRKSVEQKPDFKRETLGSRETGQVERLIRKARKAGRPSKEEIKSLEEEFFIFQIIQNSKSGLLESILMNKTVYTQIIKQKILATLLDKIFRSKILEKYQEEVLYAEPSLLLLPKAMVDEMFDSDFSEYLEDLEDREEADDFDLENPFEFPSKVVSEIDNTWSKGRTPLISEEITPKKSRVESLDKRGKPSQHKRKSRSKRNPSKARSEKQSFREAPQRKKRALFSILGGSKPWAESKVKVETGRRGTRKENFYSHIAEREGLGDSLDNLCRSNLVEKREGPKMRPGAPNNHQEIFQKFDSDSNIMR